MRVPLDVIRAAGVRYEQRTAAREEGRDKILAGRIEDANDLDQVVKRRARQTLHRMRENELLDRRLERQIGQDNLVGVSYFERAMLASNTVGRVVVRSVPDGQPIGFGTGFLVSPRLMLTNNHVISTADEARLSRIEMNYQSDVSGDAALPAIFSLDPDLFFLTSPLDVLDYTLVAVAERADDGRLLGSFGWNKLIEQVGKAMKGEYLNIIQHPEGRPKQLALRDNLLIDMLDRFLHYETDTLRGSSGAPVFNDDWEVVALHHAGVPLMRDGNVLKRDGTPADQHTSDDDIQWIANEGVRVSRIIADLKAEGGMSVDAERLRMELLDPGIQPPLVRMMTPNFTQNTTASVTAAVADTRSSGQGEQLTRLRAVQDDGSVQLSVPLEISLRLGLPAVSMPALTPQAEPPLLAASSPPHAPSALPIEKSLTIPHYANRVGYDEQFLGADTTRVPLPDPGAHLADASTLSNAARPDSHVLRYTHFSVVMSSSRRLPRYTAVNIDGKTLRLIPRGEDAWYFDPRIPREHQAGNEIYRNNPLDRGHMVRRLDPVWGDSAEQANEDTFHYTNSCPQHANLNQRTWNDLEDYILDNAGAHNLRVSVFTGPVLRDDDPLYRTIQLPREFWKIAVLVRGSTGKLSATAYVLSQDTMIQDLPEEFVFGAYRTYQVQVAEIERRTGLRFGSLVQADPLATIERAVEALGTSGRRLVRGPSDIVFG